MKRWILVSAAALGLLASAQRASAQFATFDASNLAQAVLSFLQDGDNMVINTEQFLQNLGVAKEQLEFLQEMDPHRLRHRRIQGQGHRSAVCGGAWAGECVSAGDVCQSVKVAFSIPRNTKHSNRWCRQASPFFFIFIG